jgi:hypothetical protein
MKVDFAQGDMMSAIRLNRRMAKLFLGNML